MTNQVKNAIEISGFISILGNEFMRHTGYGVYAFLTHQIIYNYYKQYTDTATEISVQIFTKKLVKEHFRT